MLRLQGPRDKLFVHRFPPDIPPGEEVRVEIGGVNSELLDTNGPVIRPPKRQPNQKRQKRFTLLEMEFGQEIVVVKLFRTHQ